jgi:hypothetical protein
VGQTSITSNSDATVRDAKTVWYRSAKNECLRLYDLRMRRAPVSVLLVVAVVASTACSPKSPASGEWTLLTLDGAPPLAGTEIRLDLGDSEFSSYDGCNTLRGVRPPAGLIA